MVNPLIPAVFRCVFFVKTMGEYDESRVLRYAVCHGIWKTDNIVIVMSFF